MINGWSSLVLATFRYAWQLKISTSRYEYLNDLNITHLVNYWHNMIIGRNNTVAFTLVFKLCTKHWISGADLRAHWQHNDLTSAKLVMYSLSFETLKAAMYGRLHSSQVLRNLKNQFLARLSKVFGPSLLDFRCSWGLV